MPKTFETHFTHKEKTPQQARDKEKSPEQIKEECQVLEKLNHFLLLVKEKFLIKLLVNLAGV